MKYEKELPSIAKFKSDMDGLRILSYLTGNSKEYKKLKNAFDDFVDIANKFTNYFSDEGWVAHSLLSTAVMTAAVLEFELSGLEKAESLLVDYYLNDENIGVGRFSSVEEFRIRYDLLKYAFDDHLNGKYYSSIPLFLMIVDGVLNDFTRVKGFFSNDINLSAWDCMVGADEGLNKIKTIFNQSRKRTNVDEIKMPFRNGILHGRDLNYSTAIVSSKCVGLIFAVFDWICRKNDEDRRKIEFETKSKPITWSELATKISKVNKDKEIIDSWEPINYQLGVDMPKYGDISEYEQYPFIVPVIEFFLFWKSKNYGSLALLIDYVYKYESNSKLRPKLCRNDFSKKLLLEFELSEIEDKAISFKRVKVDVSWSVHEIINKTSLEFGVNYQKLDESPGIPQSDNGKWMLIPWNLCNLV